MMRIVYLSCTSSFRRQPDGLPNTWRIAKIRNFPFIA